MQYFSCPMLFIPPMAWEFLEEHRHLEKHPHTEVAYHAQRPRFKAFRKYFLSTIAEFKASQAVGGALPGVT